MSIFISKNTIDHQPLPNVAVKDRDEQPALRSELLRGIPYLNELVKGKEFTAPLSVKNPKSTPLVVKRLKMALNIIEQYAELNDRAYDLTSPLDQTDGIYDEEMKSAVTEFQQVFTITSDEAGEIGAETLATIDYYLDPKVIYDVINDRILGKKLDRPIEVRTPPGEDGQFTFQIIAGGTPFTFSSEVPMPVLPIMNQDGNFTGEVAIDREIVLEKASGTLSLEGKSIDYFTVKDENQQDPIITGTDQELSTTTIREMVDIIPPQLLADDQVKQHRVKASDKLARLIEESYYQVDGDAYTNPFSEETQVIYQFPKNDISSVENRPYDARFQFYANLIYYLNTEELPDGSIKSYGIESKNGYQRYAPDDLDEFFLYDNALTSDDANTLLSNYHRFLIYQNSKNANTKINFDAEGNPTSFEMIANKYIWIPTREFADSMFYHLNFRASEMLKTVGDTMEYLTSEEFQDTVTTFASNLWDSITDIPATALDFLKSAGQQLIVDIHKFYVQAFDFLVDVIAKYYPRGLGVAIGEKVGVTWGYPIATDVQFSVAIWRKLTPLEDLVFMIRQESIAFVGLDTGVGVNLGFNFGSDKNERAVGLNLAAGFKFGPETKMMMQYELPVRQEETGILTTLMNVFGKGYSSGTKTGDKLLRGLVALGIEAQQYMTQSKVGLAMTAQGWANASVGYVKEPNADGGEVKKPYILEQKKKETSLDKEKTIRGLLADGIWNKSVPGIGVAVEGGISLGIEMEYKAKYEKNPMVHALASRVASEVELQTQFVVGTSITVGAMGDLLQRFLVSLTPLSAFTSLIELLGNNGFGVGLNSKYTRTAPAAEITDADVDFSNTDQAALDSTLNIVDEFKIAFGTDKGTWENKIFFSNGTGDVEGLFRPGSETKLILNTAAIRNLIKDGGAAFTNFDFGTVETIFSLIYSIEIQKKLGGGINQRDRKEFTGSFIKALNQKKKGSKTDFLTTAKDKGFDVFAGVYVKVELKIANIADVILTFLKSWYLQLAQGQDWERNGNRLDRLGNKTRIEREIEKLKKEIDQTTSSEVERTRKLYEMLNQEGTGLLDQMIKSYDGINYQAAYIKMLKLPYYILLYLTTPGGIGVLAGLVAREIVDLYKDLRVDELFKAINVLAELINATLYFGNDGYVDIGIEAGAGAEAAKVRTSLGLQGAIISRLTFMEDSKFFKLAASDPYKPIYDQIQNLLEDQKTNEQGELIPVRPAEIRKAFLKAFR
ncbi:MAG: peptidoglycan-binding domain-containing protein [Bacteroidota bacterium]